MSQDAAEQNIQMWKVKKLIKSLDSARGFVVSLVLYSQTSRLVVQGWHFYDQSYRSTQSTSVLTITKSVCVEHD